MDPGAGTELNLADCYEHAGQLARAWVTFKSAGADARRTARPRWGVIADARADKLERVVPRIVVRVEAQRGGEGVAITLDGQTIASDAAGSPIPLDPGDHHVIAAIAGRVPFETSLSLASGDNVTVVVPPLDPLPIPGREPSPPAAPPRANGARIAGISAGAAGLVGIGVGIVFGLEALDKNAQAANACPTNQCASQGPVDLTNEARTARTEEIVLLSVGGALSAAGIALLVLSAGHGTRVTPTAAVSPEGWSAGIQGTF